MKKIFIIIGLIGLIMGLGTAGASDMDLISFGEIFVKMLISVLMLSFSFIGVRYCERKTIIENRRKILINSKTQNECEYCG